MKPVVIASLLLLLAACASHDVHCDGPLRPIAKASARIATDGSEAPPR
jgi:hypothetical protein